MQCRVVDYLRCKSLYVRSCHKLSKPYQEFFGNYVFCRIWWTSSFVDVKSRTHRSSFLRYSMDNYFGNTNRHFQLISQGSLTVEIATNFNKIEKNKMERCIHYDHGFHVPSSNISREANYSNIFGVRSI